MIRRVLCLLMLGALLFSGCAPQKATEKKKHNATFLDLFDTVTTVVAIADNEESFRELAQQVHDELLEYHRLFDIYNSYDGINNLKTVNDNAGIAPVEVDRKLVDFLLDCQEYYVLTGGKVNVAMGSVLSLWHDARNKGINDPANAALPDMEKLKAAAEHCAFDGLVIDEAAGTVYLTDPEQKLDVGAIAKGWASQRVAEAMPKGVSISVGGNVCATGAKDEQGTPWVVGVTDPDGGGDYLHTLNIVDATVVTSGDYQRYYVVDGKPYHHIIHPDTLMPSELWRSVTIVCPDSGLGDVLSTALFLLSLEEGQALLDTCGAEAMWVDVQNNVFYSDGFQELIRK